MLYSSYISTPVGVLRIVCDDESLLKVEYTDFVQDSDSNAILELTQNQLQEYFSGDRESFSLPIKVQGTDFQQKVWQSLQEIEYGTTCSYKDLALMIGNPNSSRAVGNANNKNPIAIVIPCHRVIGSNKKLVGYAGGLDKKEWLLNHEQKQKKHLP